VTEGLARSVAGLANWLLRNTVSVHYWLFDHNGGLASAVFETVHLRIKQMLNGTCHRPIGKLPTADIGDSANR
jgi:hypothetical protein